MTDQNVPEWERDFDERFHMSLESEHSQRDSIRREKIKAFIRTQIEKAEARGAERAVEYIKAECGIAPDLSPVNDYVIPFQVLEAAKKNITT